MKQYFLVCLLGMACAAAHADIYKYTDANGVVTYTNLKPGIAQKPELVIATPKSNDETVSSNTPKNNGAKSPSPEHFPKVDNRTQNQRDDKRRAILRSELDQEKQALETARQIYEEAQNTPEVYRNAQGKTYRNVAKYEEKLRIIEAEIQAHERNIDLLNKELSH